ncbi:MAG: nicotinate-nucleotide adenylyltransferase, partial [Candidatus Nanopelagicales bacterium]
TDVAAVLELDLVLVIPAGDPWQKAGEVVASAEDRYAMALLATIDDPRLDVSRIEVDSHEPSYTAVTLKALRSESEFADAELFFIVGADAFVGLPTWHQYPELLALATFVAVSRPGYDQVPESPDETGAVRRVEISDVDVSSTQIRRRVAAGESIDALAPVNVASYIRKRGLYRSSSPLEAAS